MTKKPETLNNTPSWVFFSALYIEKEVSNSANGHIFSGYPFNPFQVNIRIHFNFHFTTSTAEGQMEILTSSCML